MCNIIMKMVAIVKENLNKVIETIKYYKGSCFGLSRFYKTKERTSQNESEDSVQNEGDVIVNIEGQQEPIHEAIVSPRRAFSQLKIRNNKRVVKPKMMVTESDKDQSPENEVDDRRVSIDQEYGFEVI